MISIVGIGNAASAVATKFQSIPQYDVYLLNDKIKKNTKQKYKLKSYEKPEDYEKNIPDLTKFLAISKHSKSILPFINFGLNLLWKALTAYEIELILFFLKK